MKNLPPITLTVSREHFASLTRFAETCEDGEGHDVALAILKELAQEGLVRRVTGNIYEITRFGQATLDQVTATPLQLLSDARILDFYPSTQSTGQGDHLIALGRSVEAEVLRLVAGMQLVPVDPSEDMLDAARVAVGLNVGVSNRLLASYYRELLKAAPRLLPGTHATQPRALLAEQRALLKRELARTDLPLCSALHEAREDVEVGHYDAAMANLRNIRAALSTVSPALAGLLDYQYSKGN